MVEIPASVTAGVLGLAFGFLVSIPVGPINIAIINEGARRGFRWAATIAAGAICMDFIYCSAAFAGFSSVFSTDKIYRATMELLSFMAMIYLGVKYLRAKELPETTPGVEMVEHRLHPHTAFMIGFVRVLGNPAVFLFWIALSATFISHEWIEDNWLSKGGCVVGMSLGAFAWFILLSFLVSLGHGRFSTKTLVRMSHISGASLLVVGVLIGYRLVKLIAHR